MFILLYIFLFLLISPAQASSAIFSDDFNGGGLSNWRVVRNRQWSYPELPCMNGSSPAQWQIVDGALGIIISAGPSCTTTIVPQDLDLINDRSIQIDFDWQFPETAHMDRNMAILWQDENNWYGIKAIDNKVFIEKVVNGQSQMMLESSGYYDFKADQNYHFQINWQANQKILIKIDEQLVVTAQDRWPYISGFRTAGLMASTGAIRRSISFFDNFIISSLLKEGEKQLGVPLIKQHDPQWRDHEYDSAQDWASRYTISRWGCALSSAAMILNYYSIDQTPDGKEMTPAQLNAWLNTQSDGYIGQGLINWLAVTRLTKIMSEKLETPVLEYQYAGGDKIGTSINQIDKSQPVILQISGHFLVADGYTTDKADLFLKDPAYNYDLFSQHDQRLLSTRIFTPSHTDLSYLLVAYPPDISVEILDKDDLIPTELNIYSEYIQDPEDGTSTEVMMIQSLAKPTQGKYQIIINNPGENEKSVEIYAYDTAGEVIDLSQQVAGLKIFELDFSSIDQSEIEEITNIFTILRALLKIWYQSGEITTKYAYLKLDKLAAWSEMEIDKNNQERYKKLIIKTAQELIDFVPYSTLILTLAPSS